MPKSRKSMGRDTHHGHQHAGTTNPKIPDEHDIAGDLQGKNSLQGNDQSNVRNQRRSAPQVSGAGPGAPKKDSGA